jgi:membrane protein
MKNLKDHLILKSKFFFQKMRKDNLFLLSSSVSYYSAIAIAPFLLIILGLSSLLGEETSQRIQVFSLSLSTEAGELVKMILSNVKDEMNLSSLSGLIGLLLLFVTSSVVFIQLRYSFDVIYGFQDLRNDRSIWDEVLEKFFAVFIVFISSFFLILASSAPGLLKLFFFENNSHYFLDYALHIFNFFIFICMFWSLHYFSPSFRPPKRKAFSMSLLTAFFFLFGNYFLGIYFKKIATTSIYGAAGTLFIFLVWCFYTAFTMFLSTELILFLEKRHEDK